MNKNLVILPIGSSSLTNQWPGKIRNFDLWTFGYDDSGVKDKYADKHFHIKKFKYHALKEIITTQDINQYDYFWFPDDDLLISESAITNAFNTIQYLDCQMAQFSVDPKSHLTWHHHLKQNINFEHRYTNFIEVMCPFFSKEFLSECVDTFDRNYSSYGLDVEWSFKCDPLRTIIIDWYSVSHIRQIKSGELYKEIKNMKVSEHDELKAIFTEYGIRDVREYLYVEGGLNF